MLLSVNIINYLGINLVMARGQVQVITQFKTQEFSHTYLSDHFFNSSLFLFS